MKFIDLTLPTPEENLALDEVLFEECEENGGEEMLRFWTPVPYFVVIGYGQKAEREVNLEFCRQNRIAVLRRISGGGTVVQGAGCLNYSLIFKIPASGPLTHISETNYHILSKHQEAINALLKTNVIASSQSRRPGILPGIPGRDAPATLHRAAGAPRNDVRIDGTSDLTIGECKFSGNAQRRKRNAVLFHGTFLIRFNISFMENVLPLPSRMPEYRKNRKHTEFLTNLNLPAPALKEALRTCWNAEEPCLEIPSENIRKLADDKYKSDDWNFHL